jgi:hypothetical protein
VTETVEGKLASGKVASVKSPPAPPPPPELAVPDAIEPPAPPPPPPPMQMTFAKEPEEGFVQEPFAEKV